MSEAQPNNDMIVFDTQPNNETVMYEEQISNDVVASETRPQNELTNSIIKNLKAKASGTSISWKTNCEKKNMLLLFFSKNTTVMLHSHGFTLAS
ncbi:hypothetical protein RYX36_027358 [Vicia faba]